MKLNILPLKPISNPWLIREGCNIVNNPEEADFIIYENVGEPHREILHTKRLYPNSKLVFILSGDTNFSDDTCIWFASNIVPSERRFQLYITNPRLYGISPGFGDKTIFGYFGGTIWNKPERTFMKDLPEKWVINECKNYWGAPQNDRIKITKKTYEFIRRSCYTLCPRGNGPSSMRIAEALACGSIPILIHDETNPFDEDFGGLCIRLALDDIPNFTNIIDKMPIPDATDFNRCVEFYKNNICIYNDIDWSISSGQSHKIIERLRELK